MNTFSTGTHFIPSRILNVRPGKESYSQETTADRTKNVPFFSYEESW